MSTVQTWQTDTTSSKSTEQLAEQIARNLKGGEIIELVSDLGGGKTTFVRGLARGIESADHVSSPTFKLSNEYNGKAMRLLHFDFYRLDEPGIMSDELAESLGQSDTVVVIEWADIVRGVLPDERLTIIFGHVGEDARHLHFSYPESLSYLLKGIAA